MLNNEVRETGRLVKDVEVKTTSTGTSYARFTLAVDQGKDNVEFIDMVSFGKTAELIAKYGNKGNLVAVGGFLKNSTYEKDGKNYRRLDVVINEFRVLHYAEKK